MKKLIDFLSDSPRYKPAEREGFFDVVMIEEPEGEETAIFVGLREVGGDIELGVSKDIILDIKGRKVNAEVCYASDICTAEEFTGVNDIVEQIAKELKAYFYYCFFDMLSDMQKSNESMNKIFN